MWAVCDTTWVGRLRAISLQIYRNRSWLASLLTTDSYWICRRKTEIRLRICSVQEIASWIFKLLLYSQEAVRETVCYYRARMSPLPWARQRPHVHEHAGARHFASGLVVSQSTLVAIWPPAAESHQRNSECNLLHNIACLLCSASSAAVFSAICFQVALYEPSAFCACVLQICSSTCQA